MSKSKIQELRYALISQITSILKENGFDELQISDIDMGNSPVLQWDRVDDENTFTLDRIELRNGELSFDGSSSWSNHTWSQEDISLDALEDIFEFLEEHEDEIIELANGEE